MANMDQIIDSSISAAFFAISVDPDIHQDNNEWFDSIVNLLSCEMLDIKAVEELLKEPGKFVVYVKKIVTVIINSSKTNLQENLSKFGDCLTSFLDIYYYVWAVADVAYLTENMEAVRYCVFMFESIRKHTSFDMVISSSKVDGPQFEFICKALNKLLLELENNKENNQRSKSELVTTNDDYQKFMKVHLSIFNNQSLVFAMKIKTMENDKTNKDNWKNIKSFINEDIRSIVWNQPVKIVMDYDSKKSCLCVVKSGRKNDVFIVEESAIEKHGLSSTWIFEYEPGYEIFSLKNTETNMYLAAKKEKFKKPPHYRMVSLVNDDDFELHDAMLWILDTKPNSNIIFINWAYDNAQLSIRGPAAGEGNIPQACLLNDGSYFTIEDA